MSLNFQFNAIADTKEGMQWLWPEYDEETNPAVPLNSKVESIIFNTMSTGINKITIDNYTTFYKRYLMIHRATSSKHDPYLSLEDVYKTIGLTTNASSMTDAAFKKHVLSILEREVDWITSQAMKALNDKDKLDEM